jgi:mannose-1-phosphate guanylyltransferase
MEPTSEQRTADARYAIVLAGGDGLRLSGVTERLYGYPRPKQYCRLGSEQSLVEETVRRALRFTGSLSRVLVSTSRAHREEAEESLADWPVERIEQPMNRDTTPGLLLPLLHVLERDPDATVLVLPSDHHISDDAAFIDPLAHAVPYLATLRDTVALAGVRLSEPEPDLGWIVPGATVGPWRRVRSFVEKPPWAEATTLHAAGALANTFAFVAQAATLGGMVRSLAPQWWSALSERVHDPAALTALYQQMPSSSLSRDVFAHATRSLGVIPLEGVHWCDIGTPERLFEVRDVPMPRLVRSGRVSR